MYWVITINTIIESLASIITVGQFFRFLLRKPEYTRDYHVSIIEHRVEYIIYHHSTSSSFGEGVKDPVAFVLITFFVTIYVAIHFSVIQNTVVIMSFIAMALSGIVAVWTSLNMKSECG